MKEAGTRQHGIRKREKVLFELLNSSLAQLRPERSDTQRDSFEAKGTLSRRLLKLDKLPPSTTQSPLLGSTTVPLTDACVNDTRFRRHEKMAAFAVGGRPFDKLYRFLERDAFREGGHLRAMEAIDSSNDFSRKW